jgi:hypothetical protein
VVPDNIAYLPERREQFDQILLALGKQVSDENLVRVRIDDLAKLVGNSRAEFYRSFKCLTRLRNFRTLLLLVPFVQTLHFVTNAEANLSRLFVPSKYLRLYISSKAKEPTHTRAILNPD